MKRSLVAFSGGVESTALLQYCVENNYNVTAIHSIWPQPLHDGNGVQAKKEFVNLSRICKILKVRYVKHIHPSYGANPKEAYFHSTRHWVLAMCAAILRFPDTEYVYWGGNSGINEFNDEGCDHNVLQKFYDVQTTFDCFNRLPSTKLGTFTEKQISPLLISWTKKQCWDYIRDDIKPLVVSCSRPKSYDPYEPCNDCRKCEELEKIK